MKLFKILTFCLIFGFVNIYPTIFSNTIGIFDVISEVKRYIQFFDVIFELHCILHLPKRRPRFVNKRSLLFQHAISDFVKRFRSTKATFLVFRNVLSISIFLSVLSLRYSVDFRRSRLVVFSRRFSREKSRL